MGSWKGRGNQYIEFARVLYCKLLTNGKQLPAFPHKALTGIEPRPQRWEARVLPLCHRGPQDISKLSKQCDSKYCDSKHSDSKIALLSIKSMTVHVIQVNQMMIVTSQF